MWEKSGWFICLCWWRVSSPLYGVLIRCLICPYGRSEWSITYYFLSITNTIINCVLLPVFSAVTASLTARTTQHPSMPSLRSNRRCSRMRLQQSWRENVVWAEPLSTILELNIDWGVNVHNTVCNAASFLHQAGECEPCVTGTEGRAAATGNAGQTWNKMDRVEKVTGY